jgi:hypothetical protein
MIKITSMSDINTIINQKLNVVDNQGYTVDFVRFVNLPLIQICQIINQQTWSYDLHLWTK